MIQALKAQPLKEQERVILYSPTVLDVELSVLPAGWRSQILKWPLNRGWMAFRMSWEMLRRRPSVLFVPSQSLPPLTKGRSGGVLTTIHDVAFARRPDLYDPAVRRRLKRVTKRAIKKASRILVPSEATKQDLVDLYRVAADRIVVTPGAVNTKVFHVYPPEDARATLQQHRLGTNFFLTVGRLERKNLTTLIRAFELFRRGGR